MSDVFTIVYLTFVAVILATCLLLIYLAIRKKKIPNPEIKKFEVQIEQNGLLLDDSYNL